MTPTYYNTEARIAALKIAANFWQGTPWRENSAVAGPGGGVSCHNLVAEIYFDTGALDRFDVPRGSIRTLRHGPAAAMLEYIDASLGGKFAQVDPSREVILPGDLIALKEGAAVRHVGIAVPGLKSLQFVHVLPRLGVIVSEIQDATYAERIEAIRRPQP